MKKPVPVGELRFGMYIAELDRPWTETPFLFQGFVLRTGQQLEALRKYCKTVYVDAERCEPATPGPRTAYPERSSVEQEIAPARKSHAASETAIAEIVSAVRVGRTLDPEQVRTAVQTMTASVLRNPDALLLYSQLKGKGDYLQAHALDVSIYLITFGRFLQLPQESIELLGYLGLLQDVGKLRVPQQLIEKRGRLNAVEFELARRHVAHSVEILRVTPGLPSGLAALAALHHERWDGTGYPSGLKGPEIGQFGSMAAIVDSFDALTVPRPYAEPLPPSAAMSLLYKERGQRYDGELVEQFIRCIGIFPVGSLVRLNTGETAVVIAQNPAKRLQPRVMVVRDPEGNPMRPHKLLDLAREPKANANEPYRILGTLERGAVEVTGEELFAR